MSAQWANSVAATQFGLSPVCLPLLLGAIRMSNGCLRIKTMMPIILVAGVSNEIRKLSAETAHPEIIAVSVSLFLVRLFNFKR